MKNAEMKNLGDHLSRICLMKKLKKMANQVNTSIWIPGRVASGGRGSGDLRSSPSEILAKISRNQKKKIQVGAWNAKTLGSRLTS